MAEDRDFVFHGDGWRLRYARPEDNDRLCELFRSIHLEAALDMTQEREPEFSAMLRMHGGAFETWVVEDEAGIIQGCGSLAVRPGWVGGEVRPVGYLCDLRGAPHFRKGRVLPKAFRLALEWARARHEVDSFYTVVIDSNELAKGALTGDGPTRQEQPVFRVMTPFQMTSVQFVGGAKAPSSRVAWATEADRAALVDFLRRKGELRLFGEVIDGAWFERRLATWPGLELGHFAIVRGSTGQIMAACAPYDTSSFKRTRVLGYHGSMAWLRRGLDLAVTIRGGTRLPKPGECFRFEFLSHLEVEGDDPEIFTDLLRFVYREHAGRGLHFLTAMIPRGSALESATRGFVVTRTGMTVYGVALRGSAMSAFDFSTPRPGFEMALN